jgi:hypothetical protein
MIKDSTRMFRKQVLVVNYRKQQKQRMLLIPMVHVQTLIGIPKPYPLTVTMGGLVPLILLAAISADARAGVFYTVAETKEWYRYYSPFTSNRYEKDGLLQKITDHGNRAVDTVNARFSAIT